MLSDFINTSEWADIIAECDPDYSPCDNEMLGLRNVHVFGLANVLRRPILLIDSVAGMQSSGDYSGEQFLCENLRFRFFLSVFWLKANLLLIVLCFKHCSYLASYLPTNVETAMGS